MVDFRRRASGSYIAKYRPARKDMKEEGEIGQRMLYSVQGWDMISIGGFRVTDSQTKALAGMISDGVATDGQVLRLRQVGDGMQCEEPNS